LSLQEFCKKYPEYCNQELYEKVSRGQKPSQSSHLRRDVKRVYASDVKPEIVGSVVTVEGVVMDVDKREYPRKSRDGNVKVTFFNIYDKTGRVSVKYLGDDHLDVSNGEIIRALGRVEDWKGIIELRLFEIEKLGKIEIDQKEVEELTTPPPQSSKSVLENGSDAVGKVLALLKNAKEQGKQVYYERLLGLLEKLKIDFKDIEKYVEVKEITKSNSLEKVKIVELRDEVA